MVEVGELVGLVDDVHVDVAAEGPEHGVGGDPERVTDTTGQHQGGGRRQEGLDGDVLRRVHSSPPPTESTARGRGRLAMIDMTTPPSATRFWPVT